MNTKFIEGHYHPTSWSSIQLTKEQYELTSGVFLIMLTQIPTQENVTKKQRKVANSNYNLMRCHAQRQLRIHQISRRAPLGG